MAANRKALQVTSNNIANANTPGYSRQRPVMESNMQSQTGGVRVGGGVEMKEALRIHDVFIEKQLLNENKTFGESKTKFEALNRLESVLSSDQYRMSDLVNDFFNSARELSANPEQGAMKLSLVESAKNAARGFRQMNTSLQSFKSDLDNELNANVADINAKAQELAKLNSSIAKFQHTRSTPGELLDRRDQILREMSSSLGLETMTDQFGGKNITLGGVGVLVNGGTANELVVMRSPEDGNKADGDAEIYLKTSSGLSKVSQALNGEIGGLVDVRNNVVNQAIDKVDKSAFEFMKQVNSIHEQGVAADGSTGNKIFAGPSEVKDAAYFMELSPEAGNIDKIATGYTPDGPSDNRLALAMADLQEAKFMPSSLNSESQEGVTLNEALNGIAGEVGIITKHEADNFHQSEAVMQQLENYRESVSGVSIEEESINLAKYQAVFNASTKAMKIGSDLFNTVLSIVN